MCSKQGVWLQGTENYCDILTALLQQFLPFFFHTYTYMYAYALIYDVWRDFGTKSLINIYTSNLYAF